VLTGSSNERLQRWGHAELPAHGSGKERGAKEWATLARHLVRAGYLRRDADRHNVLEVTEKGHAVIEGRMQAMLTESPEHSTTSRRAPAMECDEVLFERLREMRKRLADERDVPAYVVFSDVALRQMAREYPSSEREFSRISGVGASKLKEFGAIFMEVIAEHLRTNPRREFAATTSGPPSVLGDSPRDSLRRFRAGQSPEEIARERGFVMGTIMSHLGQAAEVGEEIDVSRFLTAEQESEIETAFRAVGWRNVVGARERLAARYDYEVLRIYRAMKGPGKVGASVDANVEETRLRGVSARSDDPVRVGEEGPASTPATPSRTKVSPARSPA
jgi:ATP-dependent DNA helicase RecQ